MSWRPRWSLLSSRRLWIVLLVLAVGGVLAWPHVRAAYHLRAADNALRQREPGQARDHLEVCARCWPDNPRVHLLFARAARQAGFHEEADRRLDRSLELGGDRGAVAFERFLLQVQQGRMSPAADRRIEELIEAGHPDLDEVLDAASQAYMRGYRLSSARGCLDLWVERRPDNLTARMRRGWVLERLFLYRKAEVDYRETISHHPGNDEPLLRLAQVLLLLGDTQEAVEYFEELKSRNNTPPVLAGLAVGLRTLGKTEQAHQLLDEALAAHPGEATLWLERARAALDLNRLDDAERDLRKAVTLTPEDYQVTFQLAGCLRRRGQTAEGDEVQKKAEALAADLKRMARLSEQLQARPYDPALRCEMGRLMLRHGQPREGVVWLQSALEVEPAYAAAHRALAEHFEATRQPALAERHRRFLSGEGGQRDGRRP